MSTTHKYSTRCFMCFTPLTYIKYLLVLRQAGTWDSLLQCCNACTWTNLSSSNKTQRHYQGLKITVCMCNWDKLWIKDTKRPKKKPNCHFWKAGSKSPVLRMPHELNTTKGVGKAPKPPLWPDPWTHLYPHPI